MWWRLAEERRKGARRQVEAALAAGEALLALRPRRVLAIAAHPDDLEWWIGGTLALLARQGARVTAVLATRGEKGGRLPDLARVREEEQRRAAALLGYSEVRFLGWPDRGVRDGDGRLEGQILQLLHELQPDLVFSFDAGKPMLPYLHPDHQAVGRATWRAYHAWRPAAGVSRLCLFHTRRPNTLVDASPVAELKRRAYLEHRSQMARDDGRIRLLRCLLRLWRLGSRRREEAAWPGALEALYCLPPVEECRQPHFF